MILAAHAEGIMMLRAADVVVIVLGLIAGLILGWAITSERERYRAQLGIMPPATARAATFVRGGAAPHAVTGAIASAGVLP
jgi:hypothetical protein